MLHRSIHWWLRALVFAPLTGLVIAATDAEPDPGEKHFATLCAGCHGSTTTGTAPSLAALRLYPPGAIVESLESGVMATIGWPLSATEKAAVAQFITGEMLDTSAVQAVDFNCHTLGVPHPGMSSRAQWNGWGATPSNLRYQPHARELTPANIQRLQLDWAFAFPGATRARSQPIAAAGFVFLGSQNGTVYALDPTAGCVHWQYRAAAEVRSAPVLQRDANGLPGALIFGDFKANLYAVDALTGDALWQTRIHDNAYATITGAPTVYGDTVYVPVSSTEIVPSALPNYPCCTFRGAVVAVDVATGALRWRRYLTDEPRRIGKTSIGTPQFGPSGAPVWSAPTIDAVRGRLYVSTGQNYSPPATPTSDAVIALRLSDGKIEWVQQVTQNDVWNGACSRGTENCPENAGPDYDLGAGVMLIRGDSGRDYLIAGQKSGLVYALDPDREGEIIWRQRAGAGGTMGGVHWGLSSDGEKILVGISDIHNATKFAVGPAQPGVHALRISDGQLLWRHTLPNTCPTDTEFTCDPAVSAALSSSPGLVYAGSLDGVLRIFSSTTGQPLWQFNTRQTYTTINGVAGKGGSIEADGPLITRDAVYINSGYDKWGEAPGNVLLKFSLPDASTTR